MKRIKVCSICLGDRSSDQNEIVECDSCHVTVHEGEVTIACSTLPATKM